MSDPIGERLRSYYQSIQSDVPARLEGQVARSLDSSPAGAAAGAGAGAGVAGRMAKTPWRPAFGLLAAGAIVLIAALAFRGLAPGPIVSPSTPVGPSISPSASFDESPTDNFQTGEPTPTPTPTQEPTPDGTPSPTPTATPTPASGSFTDAGPMAFVTTGPAVTLSDGRVLIAGGMQKRSGGIWFKSATAQIYDPATGKFTATGSMADERVKHTATLLKNGRVLVVGGADLSDGIDNLATAEIYDPATGRFTRTGSLAQGRAEHTATLLADGRVLIAGGFGGGTTSLSSAEIYNPASGTFSATGSMTISREYHTATLLPNGHVLIAGGLDDGAVSADPGVKASAELFDPSTGTFTPTGSMASPREMHTATSLGDGRVLIAGGAGTNQTTQLATAEIYNAATGEFSSAGSMHSARRNHTATVLQSGDILFAGGDGNSSSEIYRPSTGTFIAGQTMPYQVSSAARLADGRVLLTGVAAQLYWP